MNYSNLTIVVRTARGEIISSAVFNELQTHERTPSQPLRAGNPVLDSLRQWFAGFDQRRETAAGSHSSM